MDMGYLNKDVAIRILQLLVEWWCSLRPVLSF